MQEVFERIIGEINKKIGHYDSKHKILTDAGMFTDADRIADRMTELDFTRGIVKREAAKYNNGWIPCSEKLPESNKPVLCWVISTTIASGETYIIGSCDNGFWFLQTYEIGHHHFPVKDYKVVAWQPLPEPYQSEVEE